MSILFLTAQITCKIKMMSLVTLAIIVTPVATIIPLVGS